MWSKALPVDMDDAEAVAAGMMAMYHLNTVPTTTVAAPGESCRIAMFEGVRIHAAGDCCLVSSWDSLHVLEDFGSRDGPLALQRYSLLVPDARER